MSATSQGSLRSAWRHPAFRRFLVASTISGIGDWLYSVALIVYVFDKTGSPGWVAALWIARGMGWIVFSSPGGAWADHAELRRYLVRINVLAIGIMVAFTLATAASSPAVVPVVLSFMVSALIASYQPGVVAAAPRLVPESDLAAANATVALVQQLTYVAGPALGALVVWLGSIPLAFVINGVTFAVAAVLLRGLPTMPRVEHADELSGPGESMTKRLTVAGKHITRSSALLVITALICVQSFMYGFDSVVHVLVSDRLLGTGSSGVGLLTASIGIGGVLVAPLLGRAASNRNAVGFVSLSVVMIGIPAIILSVTHQPLVAYLIVGVEGAASMALDVLLLTLMQRTAPRAVLGRTFGLVTTLAAMSMIVGTFVAPILVDALGLPTALVIAGCVVLAVFLAVSPGLRRLDAASKARQAELGTYVEVLAALHLFEGMAAPSLERLAAELKVEAVAPETAVVRQGAEPDDLFVIRSGRFDVQRTDPGQPDRVVNTLGSDDWFGEIGLVRSIPRTATVTAVDDGVVWRIPGTVFLEAMSQMPTLPDPLHLGLAARLRQTVPELESEEVS